MRKIAFLIVLFFLIIGLSAPISATLIDRGGGMIYSTDMDITILQDANYAMTSGFDSDGYMTWNDANTWVQNLSYGGYDDWRLPTFDPAYNRGTTNSSTAADLSELAYLRYVELGPDYDLPGFDPAPFINLGVSDAGQMQPWYWSGTLDGSSLDEDAWRFDFWCG